MYGSEIKDSEMQPMFVTASPSWQCQRCRQHNFPPKLKFCMNVSIILSWALTAYMNLRCMSHISISGLLTSDAYSSILVSGTGSVIRRGAHHCHSWHRFIYSYNHTHHLETCKGVFVFVESFAQLLSIGNISMDTPINEWICILGGKTRSRLFLVSTQSQTGSTKIIDKCTIKPGRRNVTFDVEGYM